MKKWDETQCELGMLEGCDTGGRVQFHLPEPNLYVCLRCLAKDIGETQETVRRLARGDEKPWFQIHRARVRNHRCPPRDTPPADTGPTWARKAEEIALHPEKLFADRAFTEARQSRREVMRITLAPQDLSRLRGELSKHRLIRATSFTDQESPSGRVPSYTAHYRGVPVDTHRDMGEQMLVEYRDGHLEYMDI